MRFPNTYKVYIGQSRNIELRKTQHITLFHMGKASNKLQEAYTLYGTPSISVLTEFAEDELDALEAAALDLLLNSFNNGFNSRSRAGGGTYLQGEFCGNSKYTNAQVSEVLLLLIQVPKLSYEEVSKITSVSKPMITDIASGKSHRWLARDFPIEYELLLSIKNHRNTRNYPTLKGPDGNIYKVEHLTRFCIEHSLDTGNLSKVLTGKKKQYLGWQAIPTEK